MLIDKEDLIKDEEILLSLLNKVLAERSDCWFSKWKTQSYRPEREFRVYYHRRQIRFRILVYNRNGLFTNEVKFSYIRGNIPLRVWFPVKADKNKVEYGTNILQNYCPDGRILNTIISIYGIHNKKHFDEFIDLISSLRLENI